MSNHAKHLSNKKEKKEKAQIIHQNVMNNYAIEASFIVQINHFKDGLSTNLHNN